MPPTSDIKGQVSKILAPFDKNATDEDGLKDRFWDFYVIGGRFSGSKLNHRMGDERVKAFVAELEEIKVTVSGMTCGKQTLQPASQIPTVDALWRERFPDSGLTVCPLFSHSNDQYDSDSTIPGDVCELAQVGDDYKASRVVIAGPNFDGSSIEPLHMEQDSFWNGVNHLETTWDGTVADAVNRFADRIRGYKPEYIARVTPQADWLVVTVDVHS